MWHARRLVCSACLTAAVVLTMPSLAASDRQRSPARNQARAQSEAKRLLGLVRLPAHAIRSSKEPAGDRGLLALPTYNEATPNLVDAHAWWTLRGSSSKVLAYVEAHLPEAARPFATARGNFAPGFASESFTLRPITGVLSERILGLTVVQASRSVTAVRTDGEAVWIVPRPRWERIPDAVTRASFVSVNLSGSRTEGTLNGKRARRLVRFINRMPVLQPGRRSCPLDTGAFVRLRFYESAGRLVARGVEHPSGCASLALTIGKRTGPLLDDFSSVSRELVRLGALKPSVTGVATAHS